MRVLIILLGIFAFAASSGKDAKDGQRVFNQPIQRQEKVLVGAYSTRTAIVLTTLTTVVPSTCANGINAKACKRRRRLRRNTIAKHIENQMLKADEEQVGTSLDSTKEFSDLKESNREGRLKITFWSTVTSTFTLTSTSANTLSTQSVSYVCSVQGASYPALCGG